MTKDEYRNEIIKYRAIYNMKVLVEHLGLSYSNFTLFMSGNDNRLSERNLKRIIDIQLNPPIDEMKNGVIKWKSNKNLSQ